MEMSDMNTSISKLHAPTYKHQATMDQIELLRAESVRVAEEKQRAERINHQLQQVSPRYRDKTFADFNVDNVDQGRVKNVAMQFVKTFEGRRKDATCLKLQGNIGTGKTLIANIMFQALAKSGYSVHYEPSLRFLRKLQDKNYACDADLQVALDYYKRIQFLVIDEVTEGYGGKDGQLSGWEKQMLFTVIDMRYHEKLCTAIISNRNKEEIIERIGERTSDRLSENGITLAFTWESYRK
jgi:DNA replication protein DnaC